MEELPQHWIPIWDDLEIHAEIDIRGRFLKMSIDLEIEFLKIMTLCSPDLVNQVRENFRTMTMGNKIECLIKDLKQYKNGYYLEYKNYLDQLWDFKAIRDDMAHHPFIWDDITTLKSFKAYRIGLVDGVEQLQWKPYNVDDLKKKVLEFINLNLVFEGLNNKLLDEHKHLYPNSPLTL